MARESELRAAHLWPAHLAALALIAALGSGCGSHSAPGAATQTAAVDGDGVLGQWVASQGLQRTYGLHVPPSCGGTRPCPLILAFHGAGGTHQFAENVGLFRAGDRGGFVVAAPDGIAGDWALGCGGCTVADQSGISDLRFVATLVTHLSRNLAIDTARVYATGRSDGGIFTHRLACNYPLAGAAVVSGALFGAQACQPARAVPLIAFHGTADTVIGFSQGEAAVRYWAGLDGCATTPTVTALPDLANDGTTVTRQDFAPCREGAEVTLFAIAGGGHNWPGSPTPETAGLQTHDIQASEEMVDFFARHPPSANAD
jgi:polyhydroxybutyrate depolymerase